MHLEDNPMLPKAHETNALYLEIIKEKLYHHIAIVHYKL